MTRRKHEPVTDISRSRPFWEEVPDTPPPPQYVPNDIVKPFWEEQRRIKERAPLWAILLLLIIIGAIALWI